MHDLVTAAYDDGERDIAEFLDSGNFDYFDRALRSNRQDVILYLLRYNSKLPKDLLEDAFLTNMPKVAEILIQRKISRKKNYFPLAIINRHYTALSLLILHEYPGAEESVKIALIRSDLKAIEILKQSLRPEHILLCTAPHVLDMLLLQGFDINVKNTEGATILHKTAASDNLSMFLYIIEKGGNINVKDNYGWTVPHYASRHGAVDVLYCLKMITNCDIPDNRGLKPIDYVKNLETLNIFRL